MTVCPITPPLDLRSLVDGHVRPDLVDRDRLVNYPGAV
jgi:hypothetical protein